mmetsp:Transcript_37827/g.83279  ORF Transcript_37827/g.83279 Transcript_37827/m.83279 type:complete len:89 (-) Transcript_37827:328-594(-)
MATGRLAPRRPAASAPSPPRPRRCSRLQSARELSLAFLPRAPFRAESQTENAAEDADETHGLLLSGGTCVWGSELNVNGTMLFVSSFT